MSARSANLSAYPKAGACGSVSAASHEIYSHAKI